MTESLEKTRKNNPMRSISTIERDAEQHLLELRRFGVKLGLEQTRELFSLLGNPQKKMKFAHVAGTNGKGSVCAMLSAALTQSGFTTGFYSSPHLVAVRERFRINGRAISAERFSDLVERIMPIIDEMKKNGSFITYFEATTAIAAMAFQDADATFAVWETGMGGRFDATNIVEPEICVITSVALEHTKHLGSTIAEIAFEKAGIIKPGVPVFCGHIKDEAREVIEKRALELDAPCFFIPPPRSTDSPSSAQTEIPPSHPPLRDFRLCSPSFGGHDGGQANSSSSTLTGLRRDMPTHRIMGSQVHRFTDSQDHGLTGSQIHGFTDSQTHRLFRDFREENASLAKMVIKHLSAKFAFPLKNAINATLEVKWPGRHHKIGDGTIVDGAHNPDGIEALISLLRSKYPERRWTIIFAALDDKDVETILRKLIPMADKFILPKISSTDRAMKPAEIKNLLDSMRQIPAEITPDVPTALRIPPQSPNRLIVGSLYLAGEALAELLPIEEITNIH